jgi:polyhydroxyalkanoate synthesis regulator phasin
MIEEDKNKESKPGDELLDKADELIEKGKIFADKADDFFADKVQKAKDSDAYGKITGLLEKVEQFLEDKSAEFHSGEMGAKFEAFKTKMEDQADELLKRAKEAGVKIGDQIDQSLDSLKGKKDQSNNQNGEGI